MGQRPRDKVGEKLSSDTVGPLPAGFIGSMAGVIEVGMQNSTL